MKKIIALFLSIAMCLSLIVSLTGCDIDAVDAYDTKDDITAQNEVASNLAASQRTPTDINYSLERYNLIRRAYWVNGQREKANTLVCSIEKPLGYIVLFSGNTVVGSFVVDGKVSSLNSFLTPSFVDSYWSSGGVITTEMADLLHRRLSMARARSVPVSIAVSVGARPNAGPEPTRTAPLLISRTVFPQEGCRPNRPACPLRPVPF